MRIVIINGSHRHGNTQHLLSTMSQHLSTLHPDYKVSLIHLRQKNIQFCDQKDYQCYESEGCPHCCRDDMKEIFSLIEPCDLLVLGSPVYFSNVSGRMKNFMDRCHALYFNRKMQGKFMMVVGVGFTQNNTEFLASMKAYGQTLGMIVKDIFYTRGETAESVEKDEKTIASFKGFVEIVVESTKKQMKTLG